MQPKSFRVMTKGRAGFVAPVGKGPAKGGKPDGVSYNFGQGTGTKGKEKMHEALGFQHERGEQRKFRGYCNWCWRIGHKEAQCWFLQEYMKSNASQDPLQRDIREWSNTSEKGYGHNQPKGKGKGKGKGKRKHPGKGNHNQDQARSPNEDGQRTLGDFGIKRQTFEFVGDVQDPVDFATSVPTEKVHYSMNLESVLGESLQHYGIKHNVPLTNRTSCTMNVNFEVTDKKIVQFCLCTRAAATAR